jgi:hypothetical protein
MNFDTAGPESLRRVLLSTLGSATGVGSVAINGCGGANSARSRAVAEAVVVRRIMGRLREEMEKVEMWKSFRGKTERKSCSTNYRGARILSVFPFT